MCKMLGRRLYDMLATDGCRVEGHVDAMEIFAPRYIYPSGGSNLVDGVSYENSTNVTDVPAPSHVYLNGNKACSDVCV
jgi:hypothetical protein